MYASSNEYLPVFWYKYVPLTSSNPNDGGFSVILYENSVLSFSVYGQREGSSAKVFKDENCFALPSEVMSYYKFLLHAADSWLDCTPKELRTIGRGRYSSQFAFGGYDPINVVDIESQILERMWEGNGNGFFARHLYVLFEDIANTLMENGIRLTLDSFSWQSQKIQPFKRDNVQQMYL